MGRPQRTDSDSTPGETTMRGSHRLRPVETPSIEHVQVVLAALDQPAPPYPLDALRALVDTPEAFEAPLKEALARVIDDAEPSLGGEESFLTPAALLFLAWRDDTSAQELVWRLLRLPLGRLRGVMQLESDGTLSWVLHKLCGGSAASLKELLLDKSVAAPVRARAAEALGFVVLEQEEGREELLELLVGMLEEAATGSVFARTARRGLCTRLARVVGDLRPEEYLDRLRPVFDAGVIDYPHDEWHLIEDALSWSAEQWADSRLHRFDEDSAQSPYEVAAWWQECWPGYDEWLADQEELDEDPPLNGTQASLLEAPVARILRPESLTGAPKAASTSADERRTARNRRKAKAKRRQRGGKGKKRGR